MSSVRIALANVREPQSPEDSVSIVTEAIAAAARREAQIVCFPECIVPGYRIGADAAPLAAGFIDRAWSTVDEAAERHRIAVILGTERAVGDGIRITARVTNSDGSLAGFQDKVQLDPSEEGTYVPGTERRVFECGEFKFGVVICHEGWRYPETVRWAARKGAHVVFHPHFEIVDETRDVPLRFADPDNTFHEKAALCRAAENTCYFATVNCAVSPATTTSAIIDPTGELLACQPHGREGILVGDIDIAQATGLLAGRLKPPL